MPIPLASEQPTLPIWPDVARALNIGSRATAYRLARGGQLPLDLIKVGGRFVVRTAELRIYNLDLDGQTFRRRYRHQLHHKTPRILAELHDLQEGDCAPLVLLCFEDVSRPGAWCHRTVLGEWISQKLAVEVRELGRVR